MTNEVDTSPDNHFFDLERVHEVFKASWVGEDDVNLEYYLEGFKELMKFCELMGSLFTFVSSEIGDKVKILEDLRAGEKKEHYTTLFTMTNYEISENLLKRSKYVSGSRTLLRLHWGSDFIRTFLKKLQDLNPDDSTSSSGHDAYAETLAKHHGFFIRQGAYLAMYTLPTQKVLLERVCKHKADSALSALPAMLEVTNMVYNRVQAHYESKDLLNLS